MNAKKGRIKIFVPLILLTTPSAYEPLERLTYKLVFST
jgi:hypothetical protein